MDFPSKSFPYQLLQRVSKYTPVSYTFSEMREPFSSYGSHDNIDIDDIAEKCFCPQKIPEGFMQPKNIWKPKRPTIPLYDKPELVDYPLVDKVTDPVIEERYEIKKLLDNLKCHRSLATTKKFDYGRKHKTRYLREMKEQLDKLEDGDPDHETYQIKKRLPKSYRYLVDLYEKYKSTKEIMRVNSLFTGGSLCYLPSDDPQKSLGNIVAPSENFTKLQISSVSCGDQENIHVDHTQLMECKEQIRGVTAGRIQGKGFIVSRHRTLCTRYNVDGGDPDELQIIDGYPTSQALSPYIPGESVIATNSGTVYLWSLERTEEVVKKKEHRFYCRDEWRQTVFGSHPRQIIHADNSVVELFDLRRKTNNGTDLFALPSKFLDNYERIRIIKQHSPFLCVIGTDYSLFVVDERFPGHPLLKWQHTLKNPPQYLDVFTDLGEEGQSLILVASQNPMEAFCYLLQGGKQKPLQGLGSPWMISRVHDFTLWEEICHASEKVAVDNRYTKDSLLGLCSMPYKDGFITYQMDSHCDVFYQVYHHTDKGDKSYTGGPGMNSLTLDDFTKEKGRAWVQAINNDVDESKKFDDPFRFALTYDASPHFDEIILTRPSHILCPLCNGEDGSESTVVPDPGAKCHCCSQSLQTGSTIAVNAKKDKVCSIETGEVKHLPLVSELPVDVLSQMITRLWNDEPVTDLLVARDAEVQEKMERIKEMKMEHVAGKCNTEIDLSDFPPGLKKLLGSPSKNVNPVPRKVACSRSGSDSEKTENRAGETTQILRGSSESEIDYDEKHTRETTQYLRKGGCDSPQTSEKNHFSSQLYTDSSTVNTHNIESGSTADLLGQSPSPSDPPEQLVTTSSKKRRRRSSISSNSSFGSAMSTRSDTLPGFMRTPSRKFFSPQKQSEKNDISGNYLLEEDLLSPESSQSFQMFSTQKTTSQSSIGRSCESPNKRHKTDICTSIGSRSPVSSRQTPTFASPKKVKLKKKYVSGF